MKTIDSRHFLAILFIILVFLIAISCIKEEEETIEVKMHLPVIKLGTRDTLSFEVTSLVSLVEISLFDTARTWLEINSYTFGTRTRQFDLNVLYNPVTAGDKQFSLYVENSGDNKTFEFTVKVIP